MLSGHVERRDLPGLMALVSRHDDVYVEVLGTMSYGNPAPMKRDTIFRIVSITKPITAAAAMTLVEECKVRLDDPIEPWLPELANRRVLRSLLPSQQPDTEEWLLDDHVAFHQVASTTHAPLLPVVPAGV